ncbi:MAG: bifunctional diaminohydroxyphosphoribosylaminopyrimidine deaminase/5-amino-6-(5-phosphoribosylamino)uracil reductase RibD [Candidatus Electronema sp. V4]|uniref:bifunctional diaminohydroxyphosphoribosylaminopyrimidine deaminase/5-amino-6-(5-phosphoribosylamino)uracil reductase RibD n=1 Tax=Candidatus Electronema sp. V4 TaxID=3454756 RepID=UPI00405591B2
MSGDDLRFMRQALELAKKGLGRTAPNPCVGAVIVRDGQLVGSGWHRKVGTPHAEVHAIAEAGAACAGATLYVTLEPCNHTGRTPPCSRAVLAAGIARVVVGMADPNPVAAGGAEFLRSQGIAVEMGILEEDCRQLNRPFIKHSSTGLPWVVLKAGMSLDGRISRRRGQGGPITGPESLRRTHELRDQLDAILIGSGTALIDNPSLTTRIENGRDPLRVILDSQLRLPPEAKMLRQQSDAQAWIFCRTDACVEKQRRLESAGAVVHQVNADENGRLDLKQVLRQIGKAGLSSVLVEGGAAVHGAFLRAGLADEACLFVAPCFIGENGTPLLSGTAPANLLLSKMTAEKLGQDVLLRGLLRREVILH